MVQKGVPVPEMRTFMRTFMGIPENNELTCPKCGSKCVPIAISYCDWQSNPSKDNKQINIKGWHCIECDITFEET